MKERGTPRSPGSQCLHHPSPRQIPQPVPCNAIFLLMPELSLKFYSYHSDYSAVVDPIVNLSNVSKALEHMPFVLSKGSLVWTWNLSDHMSMAAYQYIVQFPSWLVALGSLSDASLALDVLVLLLHDKSPSTTYGVKMFFLSLSPFRGINL